jgi:hypothetical protein
VKWNDGSADQKIIWSDAGGVFLLSILLFMHGLDGHSARIPPSSLDDV